MRLSKIVAVLIITNILFSVNAYACDLCALYNSIERKDDKPSTLTLSLAEQFTEYSKTQTTGDFVENTLNQHMNSSITQLSGTYQFSEKFGVQASLPYINRRYKRLGENNQIDKGTERGIGDLTLTARYTPYKVKEDNYLLNFTVFSGVKAPTGDSDRLKEELSHSHGTSESNDIHEEHETHADVSHEEAHDEIVEEHDEHMHSMRHEGHEHEDAPIMPTLASAIHGHDLALGSGSWDIPVGANLHLQSDRKILIGNIQYIFRTEGDHDYRYADDLMYNTVLAYEIIPDCGYSLSAGLNISGEYKQKDRGKDNAIQHDTGIRSLFAGPWLMLTSSNNLSAEVSVDFPVDINNTGYQAVADYRVRAGLSYRF